MILHQGSVKMVWMDRYDHNIHLLKRSHIGNNYRINFIMKILKSSYLNLNICKVVQIFWEMMLVHRGLQYLPYTKGIN
jgi:hypothetical protein